VDIPSESLEMAGNVARSHITSFDFQKAFQSRDVFSNLSHLFVRLGFCLFFALLAAHYFAVHSVSGSLISKSQWQRVQYIMAM